MANDGERARKRASFHSDMGLSNNAISRKLLIFSVWSIEQKMFIFEHMIDICDEPAGHGPAVTLFDALFLSQFERYSFEILTQCEF